MKQLPKKLDCRVDYVTISNRIHSALVECESNEVLLLKHGHYSVTDMYKELKFRLINFLTIDNYPYNFIKYFEIKNAKYEFEFKNQS